MKVLLASIEGENYFDRMDAIPGLELIRVATTADALAHAADADVFYGRPTEELLAAATRLRWIQAPSAGVDFLMSLPTLVESDIVVTNTRTAHAPSIAEHVFALLFAFTRGVPQALEWQKQKHWGRGEGYRSLTEIKGSTMGIVGFGAIGRAVAQRALAFETNVLAVDALAIAADPLYGEVWATERLHDLLGLSDIVVVAAPYTRETHHLIDAAAIAAMKRDAFLIVVSRGGIVDEAALVEALQSGHLAGVGLDVTEREPLSSESPLWDFPNVIITPHLAGSSAAKEQRVVDIFCENLRRFSVGEPLINVVDKRAGY